MELFQREEEAKMAALEKQRLEAVGRSRFYHKMMRKSEEQVEFEMLQKAKAARERPVGVSPETWEWYKKKELDSIQTIILLLKLNQLLQSWELAAPFINNVYFKTPRN